MKKIIILVLATLFVLPLTATAWDSDRSSRDYDEYSRRSQQESDRSEREYISDRMRDAIRANDRDRMDFQQRQMDHQLFMERIRN